MIRFVRMIDPGQKSHDRHIDPFDAITDGMDQVVWQEERPPSETGQAAGKLHSLECGKRLGLQINLHEDITREERFDLNEFALLRILQAAREKNLETLRLKLAQDGFFFIRPAV
jgi:hypothetical protein